MVIMEKRLGMTVVASEDGALEGVLTDGDLKRILLARGTDGFFDTSVAAVMHAGARTIAPDALLVAAVRKMEDDPPSPVTSLVVVEGGKRREPARLPEARRPLAPSEAGDFGGLKSCGQPRCGRSRPRNRNWHVSCLNPGHPFVSVRPARGCACSWRS